MTPKEKAKELYESFAIHVRWKLGQEDYKKRAKSCVLIMVNEMITVLSQDASPLLNYWLEVKEEIKNLK